MKLLFHPRTTLVAVVTGAVAIATLAGSVATALTPLKDVFGSQASTVIGTVASVATGVVTVSLGVAAAGRSIISAIDSGVPPQNPTSPAGAPESAKETS